ncbi:MAG: rod shape-determining protein MreC, partial [Sutterella sp.]
MEYGPPPLFRQGVSARIRFILFVFICVVLILVDGRLKSLDGFRSTVVSVTTPLVSLLSIPGEWLHHSEGY